jgi:hypothetical protein
MARPRKIVEGEVISMKFLHMVRVLSRGVQGVPLSDVEHGLYNARDVEKEIEALSNQGWVLSPGFPVFTGMEGFGVVPDAGFRLLYFFTKAE